MKVFEKEENKKVLRELRLMRRMRERGYTFAQIGRVYGYSRQRAQQVCERWGFKPRPPKKERVLTYQEKRALVLMSKIIKDSSTRCWEWQGYRDHAGYGRISFEGESAYAHRVAYELFYDTIPEGMSVCHTCDNPGCVAPAHLWLGTHKQNIADRDVKGRGKGQEDLQVGTIQYQIRALQRAVSCS